MHAAAKPRRKVKYILNIEYNSGGGSRFDLDQAVPAVTAGIASVEKMP
jgi:hypothetical protein